MATQKSDAQPRKGYLVRMEVTLVTGKEVHGVDAFWAQTPDEASNYAFNLFLTKIQEGGAILYGDRYFAGDTIACYRPETLCSIDLSDEANAKWVRSMEIFETYLAREERRQELALERVNGQEGH